MLVVLEHSVAIVQLMAIDSLPELIVNNEVKGRQGMNRSGGGSGMGVFI